MIATRDAGTKSEPEARIGLSSEGREFEFKIFTPILDRAVNTRDNEE